MFWLIGVWFILLLNLIVTDRALSLSLKGTRKSNWNEKFFFWICGVVVYIVGFKMISSDKRTALNSVTWNKFIPICDVWILGNATNITSKHKFSLVLNICLCNGNFRFRCYGHDHIPILILGRIASL